MGFDRESGTVAQEALVFFSPPAGTILNPSHTTSAPRPGACFGRRVAAFAVVALWFVAQVALPGWHLSNHEEAHRRAAVRCAQALDVDAVRDPRTGRVDLGRLADALQCENGPTSHHHDPDRPFDDLNDVALHLGVVTLSPQAELPTPAHVPVWREFALIVCAGRVVPAPMAFLSCRRAQAPPV